MTTRLCMLLAIALLSLGLVACGGEGGSSTSISTATAQGGGRATTARVEPPPAKKKAAGKDSEQGGSGQQRPAGAPRAVHAAPLQVSGGGSAQFKVKGGDNSIQEFGEESDESELQQAAETVHAFYVARVGEEWASACSYLAASQVKSLQQLAASSPQFKGKGCAAILAAFTKPLSPAQERETTTVDAAALRQEGGQAFLIYTGPPGRTVYAMPLTEEGGEWKAGALSASALPAVSQRGE